MLSWIVTAYMLLSYGIMLAGSGAILQEQFGLSYEAGVLILSGLTFLTFLTGAKGMVSVNSFLAPVLTAAGFSLDTPKYRTFPDVYNRSNASATSSAAASICWDWESCTCSAV